MMFNKVLKDEIISAIQGPLTQGEATPWLGAYGFGEFTPLNGVNTFHNYTTSLAVLVRR
jgi:small ligand-binding sensory domain FIST